MFYIIHENGVLVATLGEDDAPMSPRYCSDDFSQAYGFETWGAASDAAQNFGPEWNIEEI